ncbi:MAG: cytochrome P450 [Verrucomicrobiota bacterium]|nr:cytochrome P450 [Verrucomicrobiota bacterium]
MTNWPSHIIKQLRGINPFDGDCLPSRVPLLGFGRPSLPFPHLFNYKEPLKIFESFYHGSEDQDGPGKHNRYLYCAGMAPVLLTRDPAVIKAMLAATGDKPEQFDRDTSPTAGIARLTGQDSLLYANGSLWKRQKRQSAQPFSRSNLFEPVKFQGFELTFRDTVRERLNELRSYYKINDTKVAKVYFEPEIKIVMLEMLVNNFFGAHVSNEEIKERYVPALDFLIDHIIIDTVSPKIHKFCGFLTGQNKILKKSKEDFEELTDIALSGRSEGTGLWRNFESSATNDALRSNIKVFLAGAMEATTSFASWTLSHLSRRQDIQDQIYEEIRDMDDYTPENLRKATVLNRVLEETLRLTPALYFLPRYATQDTWIETNDKRRMLIPEGTHIRLDVWHANRCEDFWGERVTGYPADQFEPKRWEFLADKGIEAKDMLHFGFGHGPRFCPGRSLGLLEVALVVAAVVKIFKFTALNERTEPKAGISTKPADQVMVQVQLREPFERPVME